MSRFDVLQPRAADTFDRAAAAIRAGRPAPRRRWVLAAALAVAVGACVAPVESDNLVGFAVEWTTFGSVGPGHHTMRALDAAVPVAARLAVETREAERPLVPADHAWPEGATWTRVRYTAGTARRAEAETWANATRAVVGAYNVRVEPVVRRDRQPLALAALGRIGQAVSPSDPAVSDDDLQAVLDAVVARVGTERGSPFHRLEPRIARVDGRRVLIQGDASAIVLEDEVRLWIRPDAHQPVTAEGVTDDRLLFRTADGWRPWSEIHR